MAVYFYLAVSTMIATLVPNNCGMEGHNSAKCLLPDRPLLPPISLLSCIFFCSPFFCLSDVYRSIEVTVKWRGIEVTVRRDLTLEVFSGKKKLAGRFCWKMSPHFLILFVWLYQSAEPYPTPQPAVSSQWLNHFRFAPVNGRGLPWNHCKHHFNLSMWRQLHNKRVHLSLTESFFATDLLLTSTSS